jgi:hypothetical protein
MELTGREGLLTSIFLLILPLLILTVMIRILPPWDKPAVQHVVPGNEA